MGNRIYTVTGPLGPGISWEDFYSKDPALPHVTVNASRRGVFAASPVEDGWCDVTVCATDLTAVVAAEAIARVLLTDPASITIVSTYKGKTS